MWGGEMGDGSQTQRSANIGMIGEVGGKAPVIRFQKRLEGEAGEQLRLGILLGAEFMGIKSQSARRNGERFADYTQRRLG